MAKFKLSLSIGYAGANVTDEYDIEDEDLENMTGEEIEQELEQALEDLRSNHVESWYKLWKPGDNISGCSGTTNESLARSREILKSKGIDL